MSTDEMDALIIKNLGDLDFAAQRLQYHIQTRVGKEIDDIVDEWVEKHGWEGEFEYRHDKDIRLAPKDWKSPSGTEAEAVGFGHFELNAGAGDDWDQQQNDYFWLTRLCKARGGMIGFRWCRDEGIDATKRKWKDFAQQWADRIRKMGFIIEESGLFFIPVQIDATVLAGAMIGDTSFEVALRPLSDALDRLLTAKPEFDAMLKSAKKTFKK